MVVAISTRITRAVDYHEIRDSISHDLVDNLVNQNFIPLLIPNTNLTPEQYFQKIPFDLLILSGGDDLITGKKISADLKEEKIRDEIEKDYLKFSLKKNIPIIGICRGMQIINHYFGGKITLGFKDTHVNKNHKIIIEDFGKEIFPNDKFLVNSFHKNIITLNDMSSELLPLMFAEDNSVEGFIHKKKSILGVMFHPERNFKDHLINDFFKNEFFKNVVNFFKERK